MLQLPKPKRTFVKVAKKIPIDKVREVADSLEDSGKYKIQESDSPLSIRTYDEQIKMRDNGFKDLENSDRYRKLIDKK